MHMDKTELFTDGEAYERMMGRWSRVVSETFFAWLDLPRGLRWLDVGCGTGAFTGEIIARCDPAKVVAIDPSEEQLAFARTRPGTKSADFPRVETSPSCFVLPSLADTFQTRHQKVLLNKRFSGGRCRD